MERADVALIVAGLSAAFTAGGLVWQFMLYRLSGARIMVRLRPAMLDSSGTLTQGPEKGFGSTRLLPRPEKLSRWRVDLAEVRVINVGRSPVSVSDISLDVGRTKPWWRRGRHTLRGRPVAYPGACMKEEVRLDVGDTVWVLFDVWPIIENARFGDDSSVTVRGSAHPAGRRRRRSPWRRRWLIDPEQEALIRDVEVTAELRAYQTLWRQLRKDPAAAEKISSAWFLVRCLLERNASTEDIDNALTKILGRPGHILIAHLVKASFDDRAPFQSASDDSVCLPPEDETDREPT